MNIKKLISALPLVAGVLLMTGCGPQTASPATSGGTYVYIPPASSTAPAPGASTYSVRQGGSKLEKDLAQTIFLSPTASGYEPDVVCAENTHNAAYPFICDITYHKGDGTSGSYWVTYTGRQDMTAYPARYSYYYDMLPVEGNENPTTPAAPTTRTTTSTPDPTKSSTALAMDVMIMKPGAWPLDGSSDFLGSTPDEAICEDSSQQPGYEFNCIVNFGFAPGDEFGGTGASYWVNYDPQDSTKIIAKLAH